MLTIGIVGTENSHVDNFLRFLNLEQRHPGVRATALADGRTPRNAELAAVGSVEHIVDRPEDLIGLVDAAIISSRDGRLHGRQAEPLLRAGMPVLVDKPLATTRADGERILAAADAGGSLVLSSSALRHHPAVADLAGLDAGDARRAPQTVSVSGPADPESPYAGLFFYGIHHVEVALQILGNPVEPIRNLNVGRPDPQSVRASFALRDSTVDLTFVTPTAAAPGAFRASTVGEEHPLVRDLPLGPDYNAPVLDQFITAMQQGRSPYTAEELLAPVSILEAIVAGLESAPARHH